MSEKDAVFWRTNNPYTDVAREFERGIEICHPGSVTSQRMCVCLDYVSWCGWAATSVEYPEYRGERLV